MPRDTIWAKLLRARNLEEMVALHQTNAPDTPNRGLVTLRPELAEEADPPPEVVQVWRPQPRPMAYGAQPPSRKVLCGPPAAAAPRAGPPAESRPRPASCAGAALVDLVDD